MTIENPAKRHDYEGNGATTTFDYTNKIRKSSHIAVYHRDTTVTPAVETLLVLDTDYSVSGVGDAGGGSITFPLGGSSFSTLAANEFLAILYDFPLEQSTDIPNTGRVFNESVEDELDYQLMLALQMEERLDRVLTVSPSDTTTSLDASQYLVDVQQAVTDAEAAAVLAAAYSAIWNDVIFLTVSDSPYTVTSAHASTFFSVDTSGGNVTINLPGISGLASPYNVGFKKTSIDGNSVIINANGTDTISGSSSVSIAVTDSGTVLVPDTDPAPDQWTPLDFGQSAGDMTVDNFADGVDYTAGTTTQLTLSVSPGNENNVQIYFDGVAQHHDTYSVSGAVVTFSAAIPIGTNDVEAVTGTTLGIGVPADNSVTSAKLHSSVISGLSSATPEDTDEIMFSDAGTPKRSTVANLRSVNKGSVNEYTKSQNFDATTLTDGATINWDAESNQVCSVTLAGNRTLANPTNTKDGATYIVIVKQDATGSRTLSYGSNYKWPGGTAPTLTTDANAVDVLTFVCDGTDMLGVFQGDFS